MKEQAISRLVSHSAIVDELAVETGGAGEHFAVCKFAHGSFNGFCLEPCGVVQRFWKDIAKPLNLVLNSVEALIDVRFHQRRPPVGGLRVEECQHRMSERIFSPTQVFLGNE